MVDIFSVQKKETINKTLLGKVIHLAGMPKTGKSTVGAGAPDPIFLCTENGVEGLVGLTPIPIGTWGEFTRAVDQLCTQKAKDMFKTVVIDSVTQLVTLLEKYEGSRKSTDKQTYQFASDMDYAKGNQGMKLLLGIQLQKLANQGYLIICISHCSEKKDFNTQRSYIATSLSNTLYEIVDRLVDQTIYLKRIPIKNGGFTYESWFTPKGGFASAGGRFITKEECVSTSYENIERALLEGMSDMAARVGADTTEEMRSSVSIESEETLYDYDGLMAEFSDITAALVEADESNITKIAKSVASVLGPNRKATSLTKGQVELLNEVVVGLKQDFSLN